MTVAFWVVLGLSALLMAAWALDRSGDPASRGIGAGYALVCLPVVGLGLLLFVLTRGAAPRLLGTLLAAAPLLLLAALWGFARFGYLVTRYRESPGQLLAGEKGRALGEAIERGDLDAVRRLVADGADPNAAGPGGHTALTFAFRKSRYDAAQLLLELGADPTRHAQDWIPPLMEISVSDRHSHLLRAALQHGASPDFAWDGLPILQNAIGGEAEANVLLILDAGARLDVRTRERDIPAPLGFAVQRRRWKVARILVERGAPLADPPGDPSLARILRDCDPPAEGELGYEEFVALAQALEARGVSPPRPFRAKPSG